MVPFPRPSQASPDACDIGDEHARQESPASHARRVLCADLLRRVFRKDVEACQCGGRFKLLVFFTDPAETRRYRDNVGLPSAPPAIAGRGLCPQGDSPEGTPPQSELEFTRG